VFNNSGTNHVEVNVNKTLKQMFVCFYRRRMIAIFPLGSFSTFPHIEFLPNPPRYQLNGFGDHVSTTSVPDQEVDVVGSHRITEHAETIALFGFKNPLEIAATISGKFEEEFLFMTPMRNMPDMPWYIMSVRPCHSIRPFLECPFARQK
jgi:hypothetical protein